MSLPTRSLGKNGPKVTALGYGAMSLSGAYGAQDSDEERLKFLDNLFALGGTFIDSADIYGDRYGYPRSHCLFPKADTKRVPRRVSQLPFSPF